MRKVSAMIGLAVLALAGTALAQEGVGAPPAAEAPVAGDAAGAPPPAAAPEAGPTSVPVAATTGYADEYALRPLTLGAGMFQVTVPVVLNLSKNAVLKPVWIPLDLRYGVTDQLEVFISHNVKGEPLAFGGGGVCLGGTDRGCSKFYNNLNVGAQFSFLKDAGLELSGIGALEIREISPDMLAAIDVGVGIKYAGGPISVKAAPQIGIGVNKRDVGNKEFISVPVRVAFQASQPLAVYLDTGIYGPTDKFSDNYNVPVGIGANFLVQHGLDVGAEFMLRQAIAPSAVASDFKGVNDRTLMIYAAWRNL